MTNYASGLSQIHNFESSTNLRGDRVKTFYVKKNETKTLVVLTPSVSDVRVYYRHSWFDPKDRDRKGVDFFMPCKVTDKDPAPQVCKACSRQLLDERIKRSMRAVFYVVDRTVSVVEGKEWGDTPKYWELTKQSAAIFEKMFERYSQGKDRCFGLIVDVGRFGDQAPSCGNTFQFQGIQDPYQYFARSPRVYFYIDKVRRATKKELTPEQAVREYFASQDGRAVTEPEAIRELRFLNFVDMKIGGGTKQDSFGYQAASPQGGYGYNQPPQSQGWPSNFSPQQPPPQDVPPPQSNWAPPPAAPQPQPLYSAPSYVSAPPLVPPPVAQPAPQLAPQPTPPPVTSSVQGAVAQPGAQPPSGDYGSYAYSQPAPQIPAPAISSAQGTPQGQGVPEKWDGKAAFQDTVESFGVVTEVPPQPAPQWQQPAQTPPPPAPPEVASAPPVEASATAPNQVDQVATDVLGGDAQSGKKTVEPVDFDKLV
jgi:hypothetical protein